MNTTPTIVGRIEHPPSPVIHLQPHTARRVGPIDRLALHVGVALIKWGRRPRPLESRERIANRFEQQLARLERERAAEREMMLTLPRR